jgi:hypothetical protein
MINIYFITMYVCKQIFSISGFFKYSVKVLLNNLFWFYRKILSKKNHISLYFGNSYTKKATDENLDTNILLVSISFFISYFNGIVLQNFRDLKARLCILNI